MAQEFTKPRADYQKDKSEFTETPYLSRNWNSRPLGMCHVYYFLALSFLFRELKHFTQRTPMSEVRGENKVS